MTRLTSRAMTNLTSRTGARGPGLPGVAFCVMLLASMPVFANISLLLFGPKDWPSTIALVREKFPQVEQVSTSDVAARNVRGRDPLLVDTRTAAEYAVSHLPGAIHIETVDGLKKVADVAPNRLIVVYCSVGYRSSDLAEQARKLGANNVANLEGSIFKWANEGRALVTGTGAAAKPATLVHPFNAKWGKLLELERRAPL